MGTVEAQATVDGGAPRRPRDAWLLVLNVVIVVVGVAVVWDKLRERSGLGEREVPALATTTVPIPPRGGAPSRDVAPARGGAPRDAGGATNRADDVTVRADSASGIAAAVEPGAPEAAPEPRGPAVAAGGEQVGVLPVPRLRGRSDAVPSPPASTEHAAAESVHPLAATEAVIDRIGVDVEVLRTIRGSYPPSSAAYGSNRGIEALHVALAKVGKVGTLRLGDTDDDGRMEILDAWGRPLIYFSPDDYRTTQSWAPGDSAAVELGACRVVGTQAFQASGSYQLFSVGPDGRAGGGRQDDITSWVRSD